MTDRMVGMVPEFLAPPGMRDDGILRDFAAELVARHDAGQWVDPSRLSAARSILLRHECERLAA